MDVDSFLAERAKDFLAAGPAHAVPLIEHVCQLPGAPALVAEQMAMALFGGRPEFASGPDGTWRLAPKPEPRPVAQDDLDSLSYAVVDVETTGTRAGAGDRITEVAVVVLRGGEVVQRYETLVNPERPIPPMITAITHITWEMVKDAPRFGEICGELLEVLSGHVFVAHNAEFDWRFISAEVARASGRRLDSRRLCTVRLARKVLPHLPSRRLDSLAHYYGVDIVDRHRALGDADATARILLRLLREAQDRDCIRWDDLQRLLAPSSGKRKRRRSALPAPVDRDTTA
ncbi:MAG TPA: 3'-5' exonuclease [Gemmatimonadaceae bacterium]|nr:3'-5' exonuclease [Gemmatimonadaceae bacterium]